MIIQFNVPRDYSDPPEPPYIEYGFTDEEWRTINVFIGGASKAGYFSGSTKPYETLLKILRSSGIEGLRQIIQEKPSLLGVLRDHQGSRKPGVYAIISSLVSEFKPKNIFEVNVDCKSWLVRQERSGLYGNSTEENYVDLLVDYVGFKGELLKGAFTEAPKVACYGTMDLVIAVYEWSAGQHLDEALNEIEKLLRADGRVVLFTNETAFTKDLRDVLSHIGLYVNTMVRLPKGVFTGSWGKGPKMLALLSKVPTDFVFIGEIKDSADHNEELMRNLFARTESKDQPELGSRVHHRSFISVGQTLNAGRLKKLAKTQKYPGRPLSYYLRSGEKSEDRNLSGLYKEQYGDDLDVLFIHAGSQSILSEAAVVYMIDEYQIANMSVIRIPIDEQKVFYPYFRLYWESPINQLALAALPKQSSIFQEIISADQLDEFQVFLPPVADQVKAFEVVEAAELLQKEATTLNDSIWEEGVELNELQARVNALRNSNDQSYWISRMHTPLALILNRYVAAGGVAERSEHLYHFFEACAQYIVTVVLSLIEQSSYDLEVVTQKLKLNEEGEPKRKFSVTFGTWTSALGMLSNFVKAEEEEVNNKLSSIPQNIRGLVRSRNFIEALDEARSLRNRRSHGGLSKGQSAEVRLKELELLLQRIRYELVGAFEEIELLGYEESWREKGRKGYQLRFKVYRGGLSTFPLIEFEKERDVAGRLYLAFDEKLIELIPLVDYRDEIEAFCFFSAFNGTKVKYVNYDHGSYPENEIDDPAVVGEIKNALGLDGLV
jgi:hypothetical protein